MTLLLFALNELVHPYHYDGTYHCSANRAERPSPADAKLLEKPAADAPADKAKYDVPEAAISLTAHYPSCYESSNETNNKSVYHVC